MKQNRKVLRVKGFTLIEMIVVIAIIGILAGILAPTMSTYYRKSRIKTANGNAKMVYNAAQTAAQNFIAMDRNSTTPSSLKGTTDADGDGIFENYVIIAYNGATKTFEASTVFGTFNASSQPADMDHIQMIVESVNKTVSGASDVCWAVCINNYIVQGAISATAETTDRVGYYSVNKAQAEDVTTHIYSEWLAIDSVDGDVDTLREVSDLYN